MLNGRQKLLLKRNDDLDEAQGRTVRMLIDRSRELGDAYRLKETFVNVFRMGSADMASKFIDVWTEYAEHTGIPEMKRASESVLRHREGILNWYEHRITNAVLEGVNSTIQQMKHEARGFGNDSHYIDMIYLKCGRLKLVIDPGFSVPEYRAGSPMYGMDRITCPCCGKSAWRYRSRGRRPMSGGA